MAEDGEWVDYKKYEEKELTAVQKAVKKVKETVEGPAWEVQELVKLVFNELWLYAFLVAVALAIAGELEVGGVQIAAVKVCKWSLHLQDGSHSIAVLAVLDQ